MLAHRQRLDNQQCIASCMHCLQSSPAATVSLGRSHELAMSRALSKARRSAAVYMLCGSISPSHPQEFKAVLLQQVPQGISWTSHPHHLSLRYSHEHRRHTGSRTAVRSKRSSTEGEACLDNAWLHFHSSPTIACSSVLYARRHQHIDHICKWLIHQQPTIAGFDVEWNPVFRKGAPESPVAVIQLAAAVKPEAFKQIKRVSLPVDLPTNQSRAPGMQLSLAQHQYCCLVLHVRHLSTMPPGLAQLLKSSGILKLGCGIGPDAEKVERDLGMAVRNRQDLSAATNSQLEEHLGLGLRHTWGLKALAEQVAGLTVIKTKRLQCSRWDKAQLTTAQVHYAAVDAAVALAVHAALPAYRPGVRQLWGVLPRGSRRGLLGDYEAEEALPPEMAAAALEYSGGDGDRRGKRDGVRSDGDGSGASSGTDSSDSSDESVVLS